jgi:hypothetical protein
MKEQDRAPGLPIRFTEVAVYPYSILGTERDWFGKCRLRKRRQNTDCGGYYSGSQLKHVIFPVIW